MISRYQKVSSGSHICRRSYEFIIYQNIVLMYTTYTPNMNFILQLEVVEPEFTYFLEYSIQFFRRFIKETLSKLVCELLNFGHKNPKLQPNGFLCPSCRIDSVFQFCPPQSMKFKRVQYRGHPPCANMGTRRCLGAIFSR